MALEIEREKAASTGHFLHKISDQCRAYTKLPATKNVRCPVDNSSIMEHLSAPSPACIAGARSCLGMTGSPATRQSSPPPDLARMADGWSALIEQTSKDILRLEGPDALAYFVQRQLLAAQAVVAARE